VSYADDLVERYRTTGDRGALARLVSLVERDAESFRLGRNIGETTNEEAGFVLGVTGSPGAGKSTLVDRLVANFRAAGDTVAVVAVDPSSPFSGGAILGDRVRMQRHTQDPGVYIRSLASHGHLGGLSVAVPEVVRLLGSLNFDWILVETVGVGQVEVEIAGEADGTLVVVNPGWGDSIQANKAGLMEVADIFVINKADRDGVRNTKRDLENMLELGGDSGCSIPIVETVSTEPRGIEELVTEIQAVRERLSRSGELDERRGDRRAREFSRVLDGIWRESLGEVGAVKEMRNAVKCGTRAPIEAAHSVMADVVVALQKRLEKE